MNIHEIRDKSGVSLRSLRKLEKLGVLKTTAVEPMTEKIIYMLSKSQQLPVDALVTLVEAPDLLLELGRYAGEAEYQVSALGDARKDAAPADIAAEIEMAAKGDDAACEKLAHWLQTVIPKGEDVGHHFVAVRLLLGAPPSLRSYYYSRLPRALLNVRRHPGFAGWSSYRESGKGKLSQYHAPKGFDL